MYIDFSLDYAHDIFRLGRKMVFLFCILFMSLAGIGQALSNSYAMFMVFSFLNAFGTSSIYPLAFIIGEYWAAFILVKMAL